jgi:hypothetical protein
MVLSLISTMPLVVIPHDLLECRGPGKTAIFRFSGTARMTSPTADRTHLGRRKALPFWRGTGSSNPAPSSGESGANLTPPITAEAVQHQKMAGRLSARHRRNTRSRPNRIVRPAHGTAAAESFAATDWKD